MDDEEVASGQTHDSLPLDARVARYRQYASAALRRAAETTDTELHARYLSTAASWHTLASELERTIELGQDPPDSVLTDFSAAS
jgi:hypothetical protein